MSATATVNGVQPDTWKANRRAVARLVEQHQRLVFLYAKRAARGCASLELEDLVQWGNLGLLRAIDTFDPNRGFAFSTYAQWWIRAFVKRAIVTEEYTIRFPAHIHDAHMRLRKQSSAFRQRHGRLPSAEELAALNRDNTGGTRGVDDPEKVDRLVHLEIRALTSLDRPLAGESAPEDGGSFYDILACEGDDPEDLASKRDTEAWITGLVAALPEKERSVILSRFWEDRSLEEAGKNLSKRPVTRERARQLEAQAILRMRGMARAAEKGPPFSKSRA